MLGQSRDDDYGKLVGDRPAAAPIRIYVAVDDPDALHARAKAAGAKIEMELRDTDYGSRDFACRDPEGNLWSFGTYWPKAHEKPLRRIHDSALVTAASADQAVKSALRAALAPPLETPTSAGRSDALADHVAGLHDLHHRA